MVLDQDCSTLPALNMKTYTEIQLFAVVPVEVASVILQSVDGTQTEWKMSEGEILSPVLLNPDLCANVVLEVVYVMKYNPAGEIVNVNASLVLGFVRGAALPLKQEFHITFVQEVQSCSIPLSLHLEVEWTKYGSLVNSQPQIVSITEIIQTNTTSLALLSGGSSILSIRTSVAFVPVSAAALPGYRATPTINAKLPYDFFFPFV
ncbi:hypothetical protein F2P81_007528 [Scophthalmus maximus]|uniref:Tectonic-1-3 domain-containing protein n=1 Tax=Scophthalmus maximus TaxID=52904 RepID=A0A6A4SZL7_SCOMX|nr:hypothetical protein F2P81_007528 [Scophthalmus maximus]